MNILFFTILTLLAGCFFVLFSKKNYNPLWLMLSAWMLALGVPRLNLSDIEKPWTGEFWFLILISLFSFIAGFFVFSKLWERFQFWHKIKFLNREHISDNIFRIVIYSLLVISGVALYMFYTRAGNFPLLAPDPDVFRFEADEKVPGLINYTAQLARLIIPLSFFFILHQGFSFKKHWDLLLVCLAGTAVLIVFASRTQIFFIDLWVMALYLFMRKPNWKQSLKFYPVFLLISILVLAAVPLIRQYKSYGQGYLAGVTAIDTSHFVPGGSYLLPIYVGVSFNMQSLLHAQQYYKVHDHQQGRVTMDPFTNILGLDKYKSYFNLCDIFQCWWNTGTYLFPFVQDFGNTAFYFIPFLTAGLISLVWWFWRTARNFLSINLFAYTCFFIVMTIYLSFTVRAEMYIDLFVIFICYLAVTHKNNKNLNTI